MKQTSNRSYRVTRFLVERLYGLRSFLHPPMDAVDYIARVIQGKADYPPWSARQLVSGSFWASIADFELTGRGESGSLNETLGVNPEDTVLDIGCGCGRVARHLVRMLGPQGRYLGADVDARAIQWCQRNLEPRHPNARFFHIDAYNSVYNPNSTQRAEDFRFPLESGSVDRILLTSVFTHMLPGDVENYLREMARLLSKNGSAYIGAFLIPEHRLKGAPAALIETKFPRLKGGFALASEKYPDLEVAYDLSEFTRLAERTGLVFERPVMWGTWAGETGYRPLDIALLKCAS